MKQHMIESSTCEKVVCTDHQNAMRTVKKEKPDCIFVSMRFHPETLKKITDYGCPLVYFYGDYRESITEYTHNFMQMSKIVLLTWYREDIYKMYNAHLARQGVDVNIWRPLKGVEEEFDVVFTGSHKSGLRKDIISKINSDFNLLVVGGGWGGKGLKNFENKSSYELSNYHLNRGKVNIGAFSIGDLSYLTYYTSNRLYQGMASGKPHIATKTPKLSEFFKPEDLYLEYSTYDELKNNINTLLNNSNLRKVTGRAQRRAILRENTLRHSWQRMENIIRENL